MDIVGKSYGFGISIDENNSSEVASFNAMKVWSLNDAIWKKTKSLHQNSIASKKKKIDGSGWFETNYWIFFFHCWCFSLLFFNISLLRVCCFCFWFLYLFNYSNKIFIIIGKNKINFSNIDYPIYSNCLQTWMNNNFYPVYTESTINIYFPFS